MCVDVFTYKLMHDSHIIELLDRLIRYPDE